MPRDGSAWHHSAYGLLSTRLAHISAIRPSEDVLPWLRQIIKETEFHRHIHLPARCNDGEHDRAVFGEYKERFDSSATTNCLHALHLFWEDACGFSVGVVVVEAKDQAFTGQHSQALSNSAAALASIWGQAPVRFRHGLNIRWCNFQIALDLGF